MCRIAGISYGPQGPGGELWTPTELLQLWLPAAVERGPHAYGYMYLTRDGVIHYAKWPGRADTGQALRNMWIPPEREDQIVWLVGHTRYYTHGTPAIAANNHPIVHGNIIGVHNGVLNNHAEILAQTGREDPVAQVDSEAIFAAVNRWGHRAGLRRIQGDMVCVYANRTKPETLHIARTNNRTLVFANTDAGSKVFASERRIMLAAGIPLSHPSQLGEHRLVRVKGGRIVERIPLPQPQEWRRFSDDSTANTYRVLDNWGRNPLSKGPDLAELEQQLASAPRTPRPPKAPRGYARSSTYRDGDPVGSKIYYKGLLLTHEEYYGERGAQ